MFHRPIKQTSTSSSKTLETKTDSQHVLEFTTGTGFNCPNSPEPLNSKEVDFITKMILDETMELQATLYSPQNAKGKLIEMINTSKDLEQDDYVKASGGKTDEKTLNLYQAAAQADAMLDIYYYCQNSACKKGLNLSALFSVVHAANMAKRDPVTKKFIRREDGKIIKPEGWTAPDVEGEVIRWSEEGSF